MVVLLVLTAVVAGSVALQVWYAGSDPTYAYYATGTRVYQLAAGVLLAMVTRLVDVPGPGRPAGRRPRPGRAWWSSAPRSST